MGLRFFAAILGIFGQIGILGGSLALAHEESSAISHTEQSGTNAHHGHNEATCVACVAVSLQGTTGAIPALPSASDLAVRVTPAPAQDLPTCGLHLVNSCRAPPRES
jgi:hypothetical protein